MHTLEQQIRFAGFSISRKGYDPASVDEALDGFADDVALLLTALRKESIRVSALERSLTFAQSFGSSAQPNLASLMLEAKEASEQLLDEARSTAARIIMDANEHGGEPTSEPQSEAHRTDSELRERQIEFALEEARAIEKAARDLAMRIRAEAESDADRFLESARAAARRMDAVDTGTGADGVELAQHYG